MNDPNQVLNIGFINIRGQTGLSMAKQAQIEAFLEIRHSSPTGN